jgi:hypothetical protein
MSYLQRWFCPFCARPLAGEPGNFSCTVGECGFSASVTEKFLEGRANMQMPSAFTNGRPMRWFCPACAHELNGGLLAEKPVFGCPACGMWVNAGVQHQLLHYHFHAPSQNAL